MKRLLFAALVAAGAAACELPSEGYVPLQSFDRDAYLAEIEPIQSVACANPTCHGDPSRPFSLFGVLGMRADPEHTFLEMPLTESELEHNFVQSSAFAASGAVPSESLLVLKPLADTVGVFHGGGVIYEGLADSEYRDGVAMDRGGMGAMSDVRLRQRFVALLLLVGALLLLALVAGCARTVKPWERRLLAHPCMSPDSRPEEVRAELHMLGARETSRGAAGDTGGGCGCK